MQSNKKWILLISIGFLLFLALACVEGGDETSEVEPTVEPSGTERFHPDVVEEYGCPSPASVPVWEEIPECEE